MIPGWNYCTVACGLVKRFSYGRRQWGGKIAISKIGSDGQLEFEKIAFPGGRLPRETSRKVREAGVRGLMSAVAGFLPVRESSLPDSHSTVLTRADNARTFGRSRRELFGNGVYSYVASTSRPTSSRLCRFVVRLHCFGFSTLLRRVPEHHRRLAELHE